MGGIKREMVVKIVAEVVVKVIVVVV